MEFDTPIFSTASGSLPPMLWEEKFEEFELQTLKDSVGLHFPTGSSSLEPTQSNWSNKSLKICEPNKTNSNEFKFGF